MRRSPRNLRIACDHRGSTHFEGVYFLHEFLQVLQQSPSLAGNLVEPSGGTQCPRALRSFSFHPMWTWFSAECHDCCIISSSDGFVTPGLSTVEAPVYAAPTGLGANSKYWRRYGSPDSRRIQVIEN